MQLFHLYSNDFRSGSIQGTSDHKIYNSLYISSFPHGNQSYQEYLVYQETLNYSKLQQKNGVFKNVCTVKNRTVYQETLCLKYTFLYITFPQVMLV